MIGIKLTSVTFIEKLLTKKAKNNYNRHDMLMGMMNMQLKKHIGRIPWLPLIILAITCLITIGSSPLFQTNPWDDSNAMMTMGRSVIHGLVPYKDVIEQRGPFLYAIFALGALFKETSFLGVFVLQAINVLIVYILTFKIASDFKDKVSSPEWLALFGPFALLSTSAFSLSGSPEEFAFTSVLYLLYVIIHFQQDVTSITLKTFFFLGLNLSLVFWNKYSMIGSFVAFFIWTAGVLIYRKQFIKLLQVVTVSLLGFLSVTMIVLIYFMMHNAVNDLIQIYFVQNMMSYGKTDQTKLMQFWQILFLLAKEIQTHYIIAAIILLGWVKALYRRDNIIIEVLMFPSALVFVALQHWVINYYNVIWMPFFVVALIRLMAFKIPGQVDDRRVKLPIKIIISLLVMLMPFVNNQNLNRLVLKRASQSVDGHQYMAQPQFAYFMRHQMGKKEPKLILINTIDKGFFLTTRVVPQTKYWHKLNMNYEQLPQMYQSFEHSMNHKKVNFVIIRLRQQPSNNKKILHRQISGAIDEHLRESLFENYKISTTSRNYKDEFYVLMQEKQ